MFMSMPFAPSMDDVRVTVIATGLEDRVEKAELPQVKKWMPTKDPISLKGSGRVLSKSIDMPSKEQCPAEQSPVKEPTREPAKDMAKDMAQNMENLAEDMQDKETERSPLNFQEQQQVEQKPVLNESILPQEDIYDIPTFLRKKISE